MKLKKKRSLVLGALLVAIFLLLGGYKIVTALKVTDRDIVRFSNPVSPSQPQQPLTLLQAWDVVVDYASQLEGTPRITRLNSIGTSDDSSSPGLDGRRRAWQAVLVASRSSWTVNVVDGVVTELVEGPPEAMLLLEEKPRLDSPEAVLIATRSRPKLVPGAGRDSGYNFVLEIPFSEERPVLRVIGAFDGYQYHPAFVELDAHSGEVRQALRNVLAGGGILFSSDAGVTWEASDLTGLFVGGVASDPWQEAWAYAAVSKDDRIALYITQDGGQHWDEVGTLPEAAGDWPYCLAIAGEDPSARKLLVGVHSGLWASDNGQMWEQLPGVEGPVGWMASVHFAEKYRVFATITDGGKMGLYASTDLSQWDRLSEAPYRLSESYDHRQVIASDYLKVAPFLLLDVAGQTQIQLPARTTRAAGDFDGNLVVSAGDRVGRASVASPKATWTLDTNVASLAAAPDFPTSHVIIVGGFRTGIYRSADGGQTWTRVLANPSSIVSGSASVAVKFLSPTNVIAVNGGMFTWQDF